MRSTPLPGPSPLLSKVPRFLFAEDDANIRDVLRSILSRARPSWSVEFVENGALALAALEARPFDVLVTDLDMPQMDGVSLLEVVFVQHPSIVRVIHSSKHHAFAGRDLSALAEVIVDKAAEVPHLLAMLERAIAFAWQSESGAWPQGVERGAS